MPGQGLVQNQRLEKKERYLVRVGVEPDGGAAPPAIGTVVPSHDATSQIAYQAHGERRLRKLRKQLGQATLDPGDDALGLLEKIVAVFGIQSRVAARRVEKGSQIRIGSLVLDQRQHFGAYALDLIQANGVDLLGGHLRAGVAV